MNMKNKKGVSEIISTLVIVLLVIIAAGIIWVVVRGTVQRSAQEVEIGTKCMGVDIQFVGIDQNAKTITLRRNAGGEEIGGIKLVLFGQNSNSGPINLEPLGQLETKTYDYSAKAQGIGLVNKVEYTPYFVINGKERICPNTRTETIS